MIEVLKSIEGEGRMFGLPLSYAFYLVYICMACLMVFIILSNLGLVGGFSIVFVFLIPLVLYFFFKMKTKHSNRRMQLESWIAYRLTPSIFKTKQIQINVSTKHI